MNSVHAKLVRVMAEVGHVEKDWTNAFHNYKYVTEGAVVEAVRKALIANGVTFSISVNRADIRERDTKQGKSFVTTLFCDAVFTDADTGDSFSFGVVGSGDDPADKGAMKAMTAAKKYALTICLLLSTGDDPEADESTDKRESVAQRQPQQRQTQRAPKQSSDMGDTTKALMDKLYEGVRAHKLDRNLIQWKEDSGKKARAALFSGIVMRPVRGVPDLTDDEKVRVIEELDRRINGLPANIGESWEAGEAPTDDDLKF